MFIDHIKIYVKAGNGGNGAVSFRREKYVSAGGPDGGDGGRGGSIIFRIDEGSNTLLAFRYRRKFIAENGENGKACKMHGKSGEDVVILVPPGTLLRDPVSGKIIFDMGKDREFIACKGGRGGWGNRHFATPTRQIPRFAKSGTEGEEKELLLELKMIADVGLIGFPSVGKSSLLARISSARPKIADYHFTTLSPNLGVVSLGGDRGFVAADIPGLIEGAAEGVGLGHAFLRHIDRCRLLLHVVDIASTEGRNPTDDIKKINEELLKYSPNLAERPQIILANKCDMTLAEEEDYYPEFKAYTEEMGYKVAFVSAYTGEGITDMLHLVERTLQELPPITEYETEVTEPDEFQAKEEEMATTIRRENDLYIVEGKWIYRLMGRVNFEDYESLNYFQKVLQKYGVFELLREKGVKDGDTVSIYDFEFEFVY